MSFENIQRSILPAKSNPLAPRQGLVFDGTDGCSATLTSAIGTSSFTVDVVATIPTTNPASAYGLFSIGVNGAAYTCASYIQSDGKIILIIVGATGSDYRYVTTSQSVVSQFGGKTIRITIVRDSSNTTKYIYINGVAAELNSDSTTGSAPTWAGSVTSTTFYIGKLNSTQYPYIGLIGTINPYNRALSAAEVLSLYESGAPSGADYNNASNTLLNTNTALNTYATSFTTFTGASATGFTGSDSTANKAARVRFPLSGTLVSGRRYRIKVTSQFTAMSFVQMWQSDSSYTGTSSIGYLSGNSTQEFTFIAVANVDSIMLNCATDSSVGTHTVVISGFAVDTPGLLFAPDSNQLGGGLVWYDTSGNGANITLPSSGVKWNIPTSGNITGASTLNLRSGGTNQDIILTPSGTGAVSVVKSENNTNAITTALNYIKVQNTSLVGTYIGALEFYTWDNRRAVGIFAERNNVDGTSGTLSFAYSTSGNSFTEGFRLSSNGNIGIGITSPATKLDIRAANTTGATTSLRIGTQTHGLAGDLFGNIEFYWGDPDSPHVSSKIYAINTGNVGPGGGGAADIRIATAVDYNSPTLVDRLIVKNDGNVIIGDTVPAGRLYVKAATTNDVALTIKAAADNPTADIIQIFRNGGSIIGKFAAGADAGYFRVGYAGLANSVAWVDISGYSNTSQVALNRGSTGSDTGIKYLTNGSTKWSIGEWSTRATNNLNIINADLNGTPLMTFQDGTGRVGINNTSPTEALEIGTNSAGNNVKINSTLGSELVPALTAGNWTGTNWSATGTTITHTTGTNGSISPTSALSISAGKVYKVVMTLSTGGGSYHNFSLGGKNYNIASTTSAQTWYVYTTSTANFTIGNLSNGDLTTTITAISIKEVLATTGTLSVEGPVTFNSTLGINNLGIGTPSSWTINAPLEVIDYGGNAIRVTRQGAATQYLAIHTGNGGQFTIAAIANGNDKPFVISTDAVNQGIQIHTGSSRRMEVLGSGKIVTSPSAYSLASWTTTGSLFEFGSATVTNSSTAASGTAASAVFYSFATPTLAATNASVTTTAAATVYIAGDVAAGTNQTITNSYGLWNVGKTRLDGNVGIGIAGPYSSLSVKAQAVSWGEGILIDPASTGYSGLYFRTEANQNSSSTGTWAIGKNASGQTGGEILHVVKNGLTGGGLHRVDAAQSWKTTGETCFGFNVGIGFTTPDQPLAFADSVAMKIQLNGSNANGYQLGLAAAVDTGDAMMKFIAGETGAGEFGFYTTTNLRLLINKNGNVGIGTTSPDQKLDVVGSILAREGTAQTYGAILKSVNTNASAFVGWSSDNHHGVWFRSSVSADGTTTTGTDVTTFREYGEFQFWTGAGTMTKKLNIAQAGKIAITPSSYSAASWTTTGALTEFAAATVTNNSTAQSTTAASAVFYSFAVPTLAATNTSVTTTAAATVYIAGDVTAGTNQTITNSYGLWNAGKTRLDGSVGIGSASPTEKLEVVATSGTYNAAVALQTDIGGGIMIKGATAPHRVALFLVGSDNIGSAIASAREDSGTTWKTNLTFYTNDGVSNSNVRNVQEKMRITSAGNIGIGTQTPNRQLTFATKNEDAIQIRRLTTGEGAPNVGSGISWTWSSTNTDNETWAAIRVIMPGSTNTHMTFSTTPVSGGNAGLAERMRITDSGKIGINATSPDSLLQIRTTTAQTTIDDANQILTIENAAATDASGNLGGIRFRQTNGTNSANAFIGLSSTGSSATRANLVFASPNTSGNTTTRITIDSSGNVGIGTPSPSYKLEVNGSFAATTKSFVIKHPTKEGKKLRYGSLEGPENGVYVRGKTTSKVIELPDYWTKLVDPESITVQLTPIGSHQKLYVEKIEDNKVYIANENLLAKNINCFFYILAERADVEKLQVEIDA